MSGRKHPTTLTNIALSLQNFFEINVIDSYNLNILEKDINISTTLPRGLLEQYSYDRIV